MLTGLKVEGGVEGGKAKLMTKGGRRGSVCGRRHSADVVEEV